ncbi:MAG: desulfoferrodoxin [Clostridiales Family XIII bacterium]|jgi:superoxide reductase|nr:desulfoferrodoxin [Clostridiales Family XIII bacterium]
MVQKKFYRCNHCGNLFGVINDSGVVPVCCGEDMQELKANTTDAAQEKHVPVIEKSGDTVTVKVGSVEHPSLEEHYIQWIAIIADGITQRKAISPGEKPEATFKVAGAGAVTAYEYCNLHGLWASEA